MYPKMSVTPVSSGSYWVHLSGDCGDEGPRLRRQCPVYPPAITQQAGERDGLPMDKRRR